MYLACANEYIPHGIQHVLKFFVFFFFAEEQENAELSNELQENH